MANVVTVDQLSTVATAQKAYIDRKDKVATDAIAKEVNDRQTAITKEVTDRDTAIEAAKTELNTAIDTAKDALQDAIDAIVVPDAAGAEEIKEITDLFA